MLRPLLPCLLLLALARPAGAAPEIFNFDPAHSSVAFSVRHFLADVPGQFAKVSGRIELDPDDVTRSTVSATVEIGSLTTQVAQRDEHLRSADFFDAARFPAATFTSRAWRRTGPDAYDIEGDLTIRGVTRPQVVPVRYLGRAAGNRGATLTGWRATLTLNRADFGVGKPERSIGDTVTVVINVEARLQPPEGAKP